MLSLSHCVSVPHEGPATCIDPLPSVDTVLCVDTIPSPPEPTVAQKALSIAEGYVGVTEVTNNSSPDIDRWLRFVNLNPGTSYCAAFVSYVIAGAGATEPDVRSGLARHFVTNRSIRAADVLIGIKEIEPGTIVVWRKGSSIFGHTGFVEVWEGPRGSTIEANTSPGTHGSQSDGEGVYKRKREIIPSAYFRITDFTEVR